MSYLSDYRLVNGVDSFRDEGTGQGIFFFKSCTIQVQDSVIFMRGDSYENAIRFADIPDKQGAATALQLVDIWANQGRLGGGGGSQSIKGAGFDLGGALRVESIKTDIDLKQLYDQLPLFYDRRSNGSATQIHQLNESASIMGVSSAGDYAIAQTRQRFNYQTGKTKFAQLTFSNLIPQAGVAKRVGLFHGGTVAPFDTFDGIYMESANGTVSACIAKQGVIQAFDESEWQDRLDGTGESGVLVDWAKAQILRIEYLWLGFGGVKFSLIIDGAVIPFLYVASSNKDTTPFLSIPNLPIRYEIRSTGGAGNLLQVCATVGQYGGEDRLGIERSIDTGNLATGFATTGVDYAMMGIRLKSTHLGAKIDLLSFSALCITNDNFRFKIVANPTIAGTAPVWVSAPNSPVEYFIGNGTTTLTDGTQLQAGIATQQTVKDISIESAYRLGSQIDGTRDFVVLAFLPLSASASAFGTLNWFESI